jgi:hypothetical protein
LPVGAITTVDHNRPAPRALADGSGRRPRRALAHARDGGGIIGAPALIGVLLSREWLRERLESPADSAGE